MRKITPYFILPVVTMLVVIFGCTTTTPSQAKDIYVAFDYGNATQQGVTNFLFYVMPPTGTNRTLIFRAGPTQTNDVSLGRFQYGARFFVTAATKRGESDPSNVVTNDFADDPLNLRFSR